MNVLRIAAAAAVSLLISGCATGGTASRASGAGPAQAGDAAAVAGAMKAVSSPFVGSTKSKKYYPSACNTVKLIKAAEQIGFSSQKEAEVAGYVKDLYSTDCQY